MSNQKYAILKQYFGHSAFRPGQEALIDAILSGRDVLGILPTGGGKSLCYQVPALLLPGITIVISPLISLMNDQVRSLKAKGVAAEVISSAVPQPTRVSIYENAARGGVRLLYIAPERLTSPEFSRYFGNRTRGGRTAVPVSLICVDEAHCVSQWGRDFRPAYLEIRTALARIFGEAAADGAHSAAARCAQGSARSAAARCAQGSAHSAVARCAQGSARSAAARCAQGSARSAAARCAQGSARFAAADYVRTPRRPVIAAFTATATPRVQQDIAELLGLRDPLRVISGFDRPNLYFEVQHPENKWHALRELLSAHSGQCGIIYCRTRAFTEAVANKLTYEGIPAFCYHAGLPLKTRAENERRFLAGRTPLMVATNAFGMGIDRPDVRFVIHYNMPADLESYYQEAGRAGRDGRPAKCYLLADQRDIILNRVLLMRSKPVIPARARDRQPADAPHAGTAEVHSARAAARHGEPPPSPQASKPPRLLPRIADAARRRGRDIPPPSRAAAKRLAERRKSLSHMREYAAAERCLRHTLLAYFGESSPEYCGRCSVCLSRRVHSAAAPQDIPSPELLRARSAPQRIIPDPKLLHPRPAPPPGIPDPELLRALTALRIQLAEERGILPYQILPDSFLRDMATAHPVRMRELLAIEGAPLFSCIKYGAEFLQEIRAWKSFHRNRIPNRIP